MAAGRFGFAMARGMRTQERASCGRKARDSICSVVVDGEEEAR